MMRRKILFAVLFCMVGPYMFSQSGTLPEKDAVLSDHDYTRGVDLFLSGLETVSDGVYRRIRGRWILNEMPAPDRSVMRCAFEVPEISIDTDSENRLPVIRVPAVSALYQDGEGDIYFKTAAWGVLEKIIPAEGRLQLYHLENDIWKHDAIYRNLNFWKNE